MRKDSEGGTMSDEVGKTMENDSNELIIDYISGG
jgi:hypothetical protein